MDWKVLVTVFLGASLALVVASAMGVLAGMLLSHTISEKLLHYIAGVGFYRYRGLDPVARLSRMNTDDWHATSTG